MSVPNTEIVENDALEDDTLATEEVETVNDEPVTDNVGDPSVEINVEELLQTLESEAPINGQNDGCESRQRLEDLMETKRAKRELEDFDDYKV